MVCPVSANAKNYTNLFESHEDPIQIESNELEFIDQDNKAIFRGNVKIKQGSNQMSTGEMIVIYLPNSKERQADIERLEFSNGFILNSDRNIVSGESGKYWFNSKDLFLEGNVILSQGKNVAKGCKLIANLNKKIGKLDNCGSRVTVSLHPPPQKTKFNQ
ncbi:LptA/OstA family protein [Candidatus Endowatersipora endosymbiont of Watersipora subatra]|uniref:LptA/OstA family protein n=1 Tax=Candidatus Endowatersipora endosymbiont of Watersipora subatra TaxID=3077946 RepID=UPI00312C9B15